MSELSAAIEAQAQTRPTEPAIVFEGELIGFGDLRERVRRRAGALAEAGVEPGDRVAVLAGNEPGFIELLLGCLHVGAVFVPLKYRRFAFVTIAGQADKLIAFDMFQLADVVQGFRWYLDDGELIAPHAHCHFSTPDASAIVPCLRG